MKSIGRYTKTVFVAVRVRVCLKRHCCCCSCGALLTLGSDCGGERSHG